MWKMIKDSKLYIKSEDECTYAMEGLVDSIQHLTDIDDGSFSCTVCCDPNPPISPDNAIWLPTFPEPDSQGDKCWSGDIFILRPDSRNDIVLVYFNGFKWQIYCAEDTYTKSFNTDMLTISKHSIRLCSVFDKDAADKTGLDNQTITKLKEVMGV